jgi:hypothetical protein
MGDIGMKVFIHAGMHKTGSSSIQKMLNIVELPNYAIPRKGEGNLSGVMSMLFEDAPKKRRMAASKGMTQKTLKRKGDIWANYLADILRSNKEFGVLSAEKISTLPRNGLIRFRELIEEFSSDIKVVAYVRRPVSYMQSAFQQRVKGGNSQGLFRGVLWPDYKNRFANIDEVFGRENVTLKIFDPDHLRSRDVVIDFFSEIGVELSPEAIMQTNEALSLEATALLYVQRRLGDGYVRGFRKAGAGNRAFIEALRGIGTGKLTFASEFVDPILEEYRADLEWMEARLGMALEDAPKTEGPLIASEDDLLRIVEEDDDALNTRLIELIQAKGGAPRDQLVCNLNLMRELCYSSVDSFCS